MVTKEQAEQIKDYVKQLESHSKIELVPILSARSGNYHEASYKIIILSLVAFILTSTYFILFPSWDGEINHSAIMMSLAIIFFIGTMINFIAPLKKIFISSAAIEEACSTHLNENFIQHEVFNTIDRTGILLQISYYEHDIRLLADSGINKVVYNEIWNELIKDISKSYKEHRNPVKGFKTVIEKLEQISKKHGLDKDHTDTNELDDKLIIKE